MSSFGQRDGKILVTGAAGHLGANLVRRLLADGQAVRVLLHGNAHNGAMDGLDVERVFGDVRDADALRAAVAGCAFVFHCAGKVSTTNGDARHKREVFDVNVTGTRNLLRAARRAGVHRVVATSTFSALGHDPDEPSRPVNEAGALYPFEPHSPYVRSKALMEQMCLRAAADGLDVVVVICSGIIGGHDYRPSRIGQTICDFANGRMLAYVAGGHEFIAASDAVDGHLLAMEKGRPGQRYIVSTEFATLDDMVAVIAQVTGRRRPPLRLRPAALLPFAAAADWCLSRFRAASDLRFTPYAILRLRHGVQADTIKAKTELGFRPTNLRDAVREAYEFHRRRGAIGDRPSIGRRAP